MRFTNNGDGTVTDNLTGLTWLRDANSFGQRNWTRALSDVNTMASGSHGLTDGSKAGDWRLPKVEELISLVDFEHHNPALPNASGKSKWRGGDAFIGVQSGIYGSGTTLSRNWTFAWYVYLDEGVVYYGGKTDAYYVWPVLSGKQEKKKIQK